MTEKEANGNLRWSPPFLPSASTLSHSVASHSLHPWDQTHGPLTSTLRPGRPEGTGRREWAGKEERTHRKGPGYLQEGGLAGRKLCARQFADVAKPGGQGINDSPLQQRPAHPSQSCSATDL